MSFYPGNGNGWTQRGTESTKGADGRLSRNHPKGESLGDGSRGETRSFLCLLCFFAAISIVLFRVMRQQFATSAPGRRSARHLAGETHPPSLPDGLEIEPVGSFWGNVALRRGHRCGAASALECDASCSWSGPWEWGERLGTRVVEAGSCGIEESTLPPITMNPSSATASVATCSYAGSFVQAGKPPTKEKPQPWKRNHPNNRSHRNPPFRWKISSREKIRKEA